MASYDGTSETTRYNGGLLEIVTRGTVTEYRHQIPLGGSATAIHTRQAGESPETTWVTRDHLGSGTLVMDEAGVPLLNLSFGSFGGRRGSAWHDEPTPGDWDVIESTTRRGFTGHEHLDSVNLIHMNGRVYDPWLGQFLSADPVDGNVYLSQRLNRYSYVMNSPHVYTDPTGFTVCADNPQCETIYVIGTQRDNGLDRWRAEYTIERIVFDHFSYYNWKYKGIHLTMNPTIWAGEVAAPPIGDPASLMDEVVVTGQWLGSQNIDIHSRHFAEKMHRDLSHMGRTRAYVLGVTHEGWIWAGLGIAVGQGVNVDGLVQDLEPPAATDPIYIAANLASAAALARGGVAVYGLRNSPQARLNCMLAWSCVGVHPGVDGSLRLMPRSQVASDIQRVQQVGRDSRLQQMINQWIIAPTP